jgi:hypothetical protein
LTKKTYKLQIEQKAKRINNARSVKGIKKTSNFDVVAEISTCTNSIEASAFQV